MAHHTELDLRERRLIEDMLYAKVPVSKIAAEMSRHRSTIYREIERNSYSDEELPYLDGYYGINARRYATARRAWRRNLIRLPKLRDAVIERLKEGQSAALARYLPSRRRKRKPRYARRPRGLVFPPDRSIHERPEYVKTRDEFGDWKGDLMIFERTQGKMNVASLVERKTRFAVLFRNYDRSSTHFMSRLME